MIVSARPVTRWGFDAEEWRTMCGRAREGLRDAAVERRTVTYGELTTFIGNRRVSPRSGALAAILDDVCEQEDGIYGVLFGSLVVRADSGIPGDGYFRHTGLLDADASDRRAFWQAQVERVWDAYSPED